MKHGEIVVHMDNYNFTKFHQNQMKNKKVLLIAPSFCSEFQSVSRIMKIVHSDIRVKTKQPVLLDRVQPYLIILPFSYRCSV